MGKSHYVFIFYSKKPFYVEFFFFKFFIWIFFSILVLFHRYVSFTILKSADTTRIVITTFLIRLKQNAKKRKKRKIDK